MYWSRPKGAKVKRVVYSASSSAYGNSEILPLKEEYVAVRYESLRFAKIHRRRILPHIQPFIRFGNREFEYFNAYGPRMADTGAYWTVIKNFLMQKARGEAMTITGDGEQTRDFTHVRDIVRANIKAMESQKAGKGESINIGAGKNHSVNQIAAIIGGLSSHIPPRVEPKHPWPTYQKPKNCWIGNRRRDLEEAIKELA